MTTQHHPCDHAEMDSLPFPPPTPRSLVANGHRPSTVPATPTPSVRARALRTGTGPMVEPDGGLHRRGHTVSVVIPTLNEARNIGAVLDRMPPYIDEVVLVDGGSVDGTVEVARRHRHGVVVVHEPRPGKGVAVRTGFRTASCDVIVMIDADGSMAPEEIGRYLFLLADGYQLVKGSRFLIGGGSTDITWVRRLGNQILRSMVNLRYHAAMTDLCYGFCAFFRRDVETLGLTADGFEIEAEIVTRALRAGMRIAEVPSFEQPRWSGRSNLRPLRDGERILQVLIADARRPRYRRAPVPAHSGPDGYEEAVGAPRVPERA